MFMLISHSVKINVEVMRKNNQGNHTKHTARRRFNYY